ncbi:MAG: DUF177 domain-containing protein [Actinobacteria bacterium]|nr:DUF177 domain-containing protein [Actinomycetota bacterium]
MADAAQPPHLLVSVTEIRRHLGSRAPVTRQLESHGLELALTEVGVPDGASIELTGELESISEGVVLTGSVAVPWVGACRRCLQEVSGTATIDVREVWEVHPTEGDTWPLVNDQIDVGPLLHDTALLALPLAPLCREECAGPAPERFPALAADDEVDDDAGAGSAGRDPRWAGLDDLQL